MRYVGKCSIAEWDAEAAESLHWIPGAVREGCFGVSPDPSPSHDVLDAVARLPSGLYVLSGSHEDKRSGVVVRWVQQCAASPVLVCVAVPRGHGVEPLIHESRAFALSSLEDNERLLLRAFEVYVPPDEGGDPFDTMVVETMTSGAPVLSRSRVAFDCELVRHLDLDADHGLYVGLVVAGRAT